MFATIVSSDISFQAHIDEKKELAEVRNDCISLSLR